MHTVIILLSVAAYCNAIPCFGTKALGRVANDSPGAVSNYANEFIASELGLVNNGLQTVGGVGGSLLKGDINGALTKGVSGGLKSAHGKITSQISAHTNGLKGFMNLGGSVAGGAVTDLGQDIGGVASMGSGVLGGLGGTLGSVTGGALSGNSGGVSTGGSRYVITKTSQGGSTGCNCGVGSAALGKLTNDGPAAVSNYANEFMASELGLLKNGLQTVGGAGGSLLKGDINGALTKGVSGGLKSAHGKITSQLSAHTNGLKGFMNLGGSVAGRAVQGVGKDIGGVASMGSGAVGGLGGTFGGITHSALGGRGGGVSTGGSRYVITQTSQGGSSGCNCGVGSGSDGAIVYHTCNGSGGSGSGSTVTRTTTNVGGSSLGSSGGSYIVDASAPGSSNGGSTVANTVTYGGSSRGGSSGGGLLGLGSGSNGGGMGFGLF